jgi:hypothetical protein
LPVPVPVDIDGFAVPSPHAFDGSIGHVSGFIFDDVAWAIRYLSVDTRN